MKNRESENRIRELYEKHGVVTPDLVVADAQDPESPLHEEFEWDDAKAAMKARRETARALIRSVRIEIKTTTRSMSIIGYRAPEFVRDPARSPTEQGYVRTHSIVDDRAASMRALLYEVEQINGRLERARALCAALGLEDEIGIVEDAVRSFTNRASAA